jgi:3'(2'), 5'-bisphosphate nucleotidase
MSFPVSADSPWYQELMCAIAAADAAGDVILKFYHEHSAGEYQKDDGSPVTDADIAADTAIREHLSAEFPDDGLLTEEGAKEESRLDKDRVWIVDPIDGTAQFIAANGKFDVLIALSYKKRPVVAVTLQPTTGLMHAAVIDQGAWRREGGEWTTFRITPSQDPPRMVTSVYYIAEGAEAAVKAVAAHFGSSDPEEMKVGTQARAFDDTQRYYDVFIGFPQPPGTSPGHEWDLAAPDLIINEAGGVYTDLYGRLHLYNKKITHFSGGLLVSADPEIHLQVLKAMRPYLRETAPSPEPADDLPAE